MTKEIVLSLRLEGDEVEAFETGKAQTGIRTNAEYMRFLITRFLREEKP